MKIKLKTRTTNKGDKAPFVIEYYHGHTKTEDGKIKHKRKFETLDYYRYKQPKSPQQKAHNKEHQKLAEAYRSKRELELLNNQHGFKSLFKGKVGLVEYFAKLRDDRKKSNKDNWHGALKYLSAFCDGTVTISSIDQEFVERYKKFLDTEAETSAGKPLSQNTKHSYFNKFKACLNQAFQDGLINENPAKRVKSFKMGEANREYLTLDELKRLHQAECRYEVLKKAFLFSCLTGLRWSDISTLTWGQIRENNGHWEVFFTQQKTDGVEYLPVSDEALKLIGKPKEPTERVFRNLKYSAYMNTALQQWVLKAGITKDITFHCGRHTFAVIYLSQGGNIYTLSKLLGHRELRTTEIYAKVIDQSKIDAVMNFPKIGL